MNPSQIVAAPRIDPEDRIFDSPSSSVSSVESDTEDYEDDIIPARQQLLSTLQESLDDIRANVLELTQRTPEPRNDSQVSAVTDQINSISGRITRIRQQNLAHLQHQQNASINPTMSSPRQNPTSPNPAVEENGDVSLATSRSAHNYFIGDEALRRQVMALNREESVARATILAPEESSGGREAAISHLNHVTRQRRQAEQERARREHLPHLYGTLEERQGAEDPSPIASLFARQVPTQPEPQDYVTRYNNSVAASEQQSQDYNRIWTSRLRAFRGGPPQASDPFTHAYYGFSDEPVANGPLTDAETYRVWTQRYRTGQVTRGQSDQPRASLDTDSTRPEPLAAEAMIIQMECKICYAQISNHALLPCGT
ncbi:MAG: hypothetical protein Q9210_001367 [Variospora velana]